MKHTTGITEYEELTATELRSLVEQNNPFTTEALEYLSVYAIEGEPFLGITVPANGG